MKKLFLLIGILFFYSCSPKLSSLQLDEFKQIQNDIKHIDFIRDTREYETKYPNFYFYQTLLPISELTTRLEKHALKIQLNEMSGIIKENDNYGFIKVVGKDKGQLLRVKYIYLNDKSENGELARKVLLAYQKGKTFSSLAIQYGKDGNAKKGGDLGWVKASLLVPDFVEAVSKQKKGAVFMTNTDDFGWYVIEKTHNIAEGEYLKIIKVIKHN